MRVFEVIILVLSVAPCFGEVLMRLRRITVSSGTDKEDNEPEIQLIVDEYSGRYNSSMSYRQRDLEDSMKRDLYDYSTSYHYRNLGRTKDRDFFDDSMSYRF